MLTILLTLLCGVILGTLLFAICSLYLLKIKCPQCKKLKPLKEIIFFHWKQRMITGQACSRCQKPKTQINL